MASIKGTYLQSVNHYKKYLEGITKIVTYFEDKFGEENPVLDIFWQAGDGMTVLYKNEELDSNNAFIEYQDFKNLLKFDNVKELLNFLENKGG